MSLDHEAAWWGDCTNTWGEEWKQLSYAPRMGLTVTHNNGQYPAWDIGRQNVLDIGGGPTSMLLKAFNTGSSLGIVDPCQYPSWVMERYKMKNIVYAMVPAEQFEAAIPYDECWIYNVLQHTEDPRKVIEQARKSARLLRLFEWVEIPADSAHPHVLTAENLDEWCGGGGQMEKNIDLTWNPDAGSLAYFGVFT